MYDSSRRFLGRRKRNMVLCFVNAGFYEFSPIVHKYIVYD
jgi:hypothetical protein